MTGSGRNYTDSHLASTSDQFLRSFLYAALATLAAFVIAYPLAYVIAFRGGRWKNLLLGSSSSRSSPTT